MLGVGRDRVGGAGGERDSQVLLHPKTEPSRANKGYVIRVQGLCDTSTAPTTFVIGEDGCRKHNFLGSTAGIVTNNGRED